MFPTDVDFDFRRRSLTCGTGQGVTWPRSIPQQSFRFYDNRQKYLAFVNTCNEKAVVARRAGQELELVRPTPPALNIFDAGMGDGTVLSRLMRHAHSMHPAVPMVAVAKEISLEDVRLGLEKMPDRFTEHPATVLVITNLNYADAPRLMLRDLQLAAALNWQEIRLIGDSAHAYEEQIEEVSDTLADAWSTHPSEKTGNPVYRRPSVLVVYRDDHKFLLDSVIPRPGRPPPHYDLILASQPWRARMSAEFKASRVLAPLTRALAPGGRLLAIQSAGRDPALEIIQKLWPGENPFEVDRHALLEALKSGTGPGGARFHPGGAVGRRGAAALRDAHAAVGAVRPHRHVDAVRGLERGGVCEPDGRRAAGAHRARVARI